MQAANACGAGPVVVDTSLSTVRSMRCRTSDDKGSPANMPTICSWMLLLIDAANYRPHRPRVSRAGDGRGQRCRQRAEPHRRERTTCSGADRPRVELLQNAAAVPIAGARWEAGTLRAGPLPTWHELGVPRDGQAGPAAGRGTAAAWCADADRGGGAMELPDVRIAGRARRGRPPRGTWRDHGGRRGRWLAGHGERPLSPVTKPAR